jgi:hypothetical protein
VSTISVVVPTIAGREAWLERCWAAYEAHSGGVELELLVERDHPACGLAWAAGGAVATGDFIHFSADDLEPHEGWWQAAVVSCERGQLPCPRVLNTDGTLQSCGEWGQEMPEGSVTYIARVPFLSREQWELGGWIFPEHYYTDNAIAWRGSQLGIDTVVCRECVFTHHFAPEGRLGYDRMEADHAAFQAWCRSSDAGR